MHFNLSSFKKPSRYIGNEINIIHKESDLKVALCFPDTYEIGMSHIGLKILYSIINNIPYASAERFFAPWSDFESFLREKSLPLRSVEEKRPLNEFDIVGFTLQYELSYTNVLNMLDLGGIPVRSNKRDNSSPLIIAGGPCTVNPLPIAPFIDAFVIGDGEEIIEEILGIYSEIRGQGSGVSKRNILAELAGLQGVYVPSVHDTGKDKIRKRVVADLDNAMFHDKPVVPYTSIVHDRVAIEISRGCTKGCRFCQAGMIYRPLRERSPEKVLSLAEASIANTGYEDISFTSLSAGDYSGLQNLIRNFNSLCSGQQISVSLPSLRVGGISSDLLKEIKSVRKTGFTIAPEAGTARLRNVINKDFTEEEYEETLRKLFSEGWKKIKLYFMIGLPTETDEDLNGIISMVRTASKMGRKITGRRVEINVGVSAFVPKAHTPFQWFGQTPFNDLRKKQDYLRKGLRKIGANFKGQHIELSLLEAVFSRGDTDSADLLENAWRSGCLFDGWSEFFSFDKWLHAAKKTGIDLYKYASRSFDPEDNLPWAFIDTGINQKFFKSEYQNALIGKITPDCRSVCYNCGLDCKDRTVVTPESFKSGQAEPAYPAGRQRTQTSEPLTHTKARVKFSKTGELRYLSHQEVMTTILRTARRAGIPISYSEGFHPHPKISFGPALPTGVEGLCEYFDIVVSGPVDPSDLLVKLNIELPDGLKAIDAVQAPQKGISLNDLISCYDYEITINETAHKAIISFMSLRNCLASREKRDVDIRPMVERAEIDGTALHITLVDNNNIKTRIFEVLEKILQKPIGEIQKMEIKRTGLYGYNKKERVEPLNMEKVWQK